jgi:hypothetical protein
MQWRVRGGSSATRAMRKQQRERWAPKPLVKGKPAPPPAEPPVPPPAP